MRGPSSYLGWLVWLILLVSHRFLVLTTYCIDIVSTGYNSSTPTFKPLIQICRAVCIRWRDVIDNAPESSHFSIYFFGLAPNSWLRTGIRKLFHLQGRPSRTKKGCELLISLRSTGHRPPSFIGSFSMGCPLSNQSKARFMDCM